MARKDILEVVKTALDSPKRNFTEGVDLAINLQNVDMSKPQNRIDEDVILPSGFGKPVKIAIFASGELAVKAKNAGADLILSLDQIEKLGKNKPGAKSIVNEYDFFLADASLMPAIGKNLGPVLGPPGKMPRPITSTVNIATIIEKLRKTVRIRSKDKTTFHMTVGCKTMSPEEIAANVEVIIKQLESKLEKGTNNIHSIYVKTTMGPAARVI